MKKITTGILTVLLMTVFSFSSKAQAFEEGSTYISAGYGFGTFTKSLFDAYSSGTSGYSYKGTGPVFAKVGFAVSEKVEFGLNLAYAGAEIKWNVNDGLGNSTTNVGTINWSAWSANARMNLHFGDHDKFDPYWGVGLGYRSSTWKFSYTDPNYDEDETIKSAIPLGFETTFGVRYLFTDNIGAYAELGIAKAMLQFGLTAKL
jgi:opacity protein-like surface antigen